MDETAVSGARRAWQFARRLQSVLGLVVIVVAAVCFSPRAYSDGSIIFLGWDNITDILRQVSEIGIISLGMTFVILTAGIDLSVGSMLALSATLSARLITGWSPGQGTSTIRFLDAVFSGFARLFSGPDPLLGQGWHITLVVLLVVLFTAALGALNGAVIAHLRLQPFIVTLAAMIGVRGFARALTNNANIDVGFGSDVSAVFAGALGPKPVVIAVFVVIAVLFMVLLGRTVFGRYVRAMGDNETAARYAGLPTRKVQIAVYMLSGMLAGLAGVLHCAQNHQGSPNDGVAYELDAIAAVVIGGTSLAGGKGTVWGTIVGTLIMGVLTNLFRLRGVDINVEMMVKAVIIVAAVRLQQKDRRG